MHFDASTHLNRLIDAVLVRLLALCVVLYLLLVQPVDGEGDEGGGAAAVDQATELE